MLACFVSLPIALAIMAFALMAVAHDLRTGQTESVQTIGDTLAPFVLGGNTVSLSFGAQEVSTEGWVPVFHRTTNLNGDSLEQSIATRDSGAVSSKLRADRIHNQLSVSTFFTEQENVPEEVLEEAGTPAQRFAAAAAQSGRAQMVRALEVKVHPDDQERAEQIVRSYLREVQASGHVG